MDPNTQSQLILDAPAPDGAPAAPPPPPDPPRPGVSPRELAARPNEERIAMLRGLTWIDYPRATQILTRLRWVMTQPRTHRMTGLTLSGPSGNGKTTIVHEFIRRESSRPASAASDREPIEFLDVNAPSKADVSLFYSIILRRLGDAKAYKGNRIEKETRVLRLLGQLSPRMLILDEIHNVLVGGPRLTEFFLNTLKSLSNELRLPIVLVGTEDAVNVIQIDAQVESRYPAVELPVWSYDEFRGLLRRAVGMMPLRGASRITAEDARWLHGRTRGVLGELVSTLQLAASEAITGGREVIDREVLEAALNLTNRVR